VLTTILIIEDPLLAALSCSFWPRDLLLAFAAERGSLYPPRYEPELPQRELRPYRGLENYMRYREISGY
jgi:hypothetical protein